MIEKTIVQTFFLILKHILGYVRTVKVIMNSLGTINVTLVLGIMIAKVKIVGYVQQAITSMVQLENVIKYLKIVLLIV